MCSAKYISIRINILARRGYANTEMPLVFKKEKKFVYFDNEVRINPASLPFQAEISRCHVKGMGWLAWRSWDRNIGLRF